MLLEPGRIAIVVVPVDQSLPALLPKEQEHRKS